jgi:hypothetical protein
MEEGVARRGAVFRSMVFPEHRVNCERGFSDRKNITFSYSSALKRHRSSDASLSTKLFKQRHFPSLTQR